MAGVFTDNQIDVNVDASQAVWHQERVATFMACLFMAKAMCGMFAVARSYAEIWRANLVMFSWMLSMAIAVLAQPCCTQWLGGDDSLEQLLWLAVAAQA